MALENLSVLAVPGSVIVHDNYTINDEIIVEIRGSGKSIRAVVPPDVVLGVTNKWGEALGGITKSSLGSAVDSVLQNVTGSTLAGNPLFSRVTYQGTEPFGISLNLNFADQINPEKGVWAPCKDLLAMASPAAVDKKSLFTYTIPGPVAFPEVSTFWGNLTKGASKAVLYERPITIRFGRLFEIDRCYIKDIRVAFKSYFIGGYPTSATVSLTIGSQRGMAEISFSIKDDLKALFDKNNKGISGFKQKVLGI